VDDIDIYPDMQQLPSEKQGWTTMTFSLVNIDLAKAMHRLVSAISLSSPSSPPSEELRAQVIREVGARVEKRVERCNPVIPKQRLTLTCSRFMVRKLDFITRIQWMVLQRPGPHADFVTEENLIEALEILESKLTTDHGLLKQYMWTNKAFPQYHVTLYILLHLCFKPDSPSVNVERAWAAVETMSALELLDGSSTGYGSKAAVLAALKTKAVSVRERFQRQELEENMRNADHDVGLAPREALAEGEDQFSCQIRNAGSSIFSVDDLNEWPAWTTFAQGFQLDSPGEFWE
jgi:hypothetical protein